VSRGIIATPHHLASDVGARVLRDGGNAVDAAVAANAVLCVVYPHMTSIGGDLFAMIWPPGAQAPVGLAGAGRSGALATIEHVRAQGHETMPERGPLTVTVPGTAEAWGRLVERFGTWGMAPLMEPAAALARDGWMVSRGLARALSEHGPWLCQEEEAWRLWPRLEEGMTLRNPELARVLDQVGAEGFDGFYRGDVARAIVATLEARGGLVTREDLALHRSAWVEPFSFPYRDVTIYELPPPTQGLVAAGLLTRLDRWSPDDLRPGVVFARALLEARDSVYPLRDRYLTDPEFSPVPREPFLDPGHDASGEGGPVPEGDTIYLCVADAQGMLVSLIQSVAGAFGSGVVARGTGILLQNRGSSFSLDPNHVNRLEPRKRTMHTLIPAMATRNGRPWAVFGTMGGDGQPQVQTQVLRCLVDEGMHPQQAVAMPRMRVWPEGGGIWVEADHPDAAGVLRTVENARPLAPGDVLLGHAHAIVLGAGGGWAAGADPRSDGKVAEA
jgi:gamma-glutamyltranspeptidase/glutathione hydrolase